MKITFNIAGQSISVLSCKLDDTLRSAMEKALKQGKFVGDANKYLVVSNSDRYDCVIPLDMTLRNIKSTGLMIIPRFTGCFSGSPKRTKLTKDEEGLISFFADLAEAQIDYSIGAKIHSFDDIKANASIIADAMRTVLLNTSADSITMEQFLKQLPCPNRNNEDSHICGYYGNKIKNCDDTAWAAFQREKRGKKHADKN